jgi:hypothetical protein
MRTWLMRFWRPTRAETLVIQPNAVLALPREKSRTLLSLCLGHQNMRACRGLCVRLAGCMAYLKRELLARTGAEGLHGDRGGGVLPAEDSRPDSAGAGSPEEEDGD